MTKKRKATPKRIAESCKAAADWHTEEAKELRKRGDYFRASQEEAKASRSRCDAARIRRDSAKKK